MKKQPKGTFCNIPLKMVEGFSPIRQAVFSWLCFYADKEMECFPSIELLCKKCGAKKTAVKEAITHLETIGYVTKKRRPNKSNFYQIILPNIETKVEKKEGEEKLSTGENPESRLTAIQESGEPLNDPRIAVKRPLTITTELYLKEKEEKEKEVFFIFEYWKEKTKHENATLDSSYKQIIEKALKLGYTVEKLIQAIDGCLISPWHKERSYDGLGLIFFNVERIDRFIKIYKQSKGRGLFHDEIREKERVKNEAKA